MRNKYHNYFIALIVIQLFIFISCTSNNQKNEFEWNEDNFIYNNFSVGASNISGSLSYSRLGTKDEESKACKKNDITVTGQYSKAYMLEKPFIFTLVDTVDVLFQNVFTTESFTYKWSGTILTEQNCYPYSFLFRFTHSREDLDDTHRNYSEL